MNNIKFSVMIPVYNVEEYLHQCIESVLNQNYENKEIILVNDGSTDNSGEICDKYADKYDFITVIHQENMGQYMTRKKALKHATGDYCLYMDSDDFWEPDLLEEVNNVIEKTECDVVLFDRRDIRINKTVEVGLDFEDGRVFVDKDKQILYNMLVGTDALNSLALKAFRKGLLPFVSSEEGFDGVCFGEDAFESARMLINAEKVVYLARCLYNYRRNVGVTGEKRVEVLEKVTYSNTKILELFENAKIDVSEGEKRLMASYMKELVKRIIYGVIAFSEQYQKIFEAVVCTEFYKKAKVSASCELNLLEKFILKMEENKKYVLVRIIAYAFEAKNKILRLISSRGSRK